MQISKDSKKESTSQYIRTNLECEVGPIVKHMVLFERCVPRCFDRKLAICSLLVQVESEISRQA